MSKLQIRHPEKSVSTGAYSDAVWMDGWLYISGQGPLDLATGKVVRGTIEEETLLTLSHIKKILEAAGGRVEDIVKCTVCPTNRFHTIPVRSYEREYTDRNSRAWVDGKQYCHLPSGGGTSRHVVGKKHGGRRSGARTDQWLFESAS